MGKRSEQLRKLVRIIWEDAPKKIEDIYTHAFWGTSAITVYLMLSFLAEFLKVSIGGVPHQVGLPIILTYALFLFLYSGMKEILRATEEEYHSTKLGRLFVVLWGVECAVFAVLDDIFTGRFAFPEDLLEVAFGVFCVMLITEFAKRKIEKSKEKDKETKKARSK